MDRPVWVLSDLDSEFKIIMGSSVFAHLLGADPAKRTYFINIKLRLNGIQPVNCSEQGEDALAGLVSGKGICIITGMESNVYA